LYIYIYRIHVIVRANETNVFMLSVFDKITKSKLYFYKTVPFLRTINPGKPVEKKISKNH